MTRLQMARKASELKLTRRRECSTTWITKLKASICCSTTSTPIMKLKIKRTVHKGMLSAANECRLVTQSRAKNSARGKYIPRLLPNKLCSQCRRATKLTRWQGMRRTRRGRYHEEGKRLRVWHAMAVKWQFSLRRQSQQPPLRTAQTTITKRQREALPIGRSTA